MKRVLTLVVLLVGCWAAFPPLARAQLALDTVDYFDAKTKKQTTVGGEIMQETPAGIKIKEGKVVRSIPALAIKEVIYHSKVDRITFRKGFTAEFKALKSEKAYERGALLTEALQEFQSLAREVRDSPNVHRYIQYKIAQTKVRLAQGEGASKAMMAEAIASLAAYKDEFRGGWEIVPCLKMLAKLYEEQGEPAKARQAYEAILLLSDVAPEVRQQSDLRVAQMMLRAKEYREAEKKLNTLAAALAAEDPRKALVQVYLVETRIAQNKLDNVEATLKSALQANSDPRLKAAAHNLLGDYFRMKKQDEEALWQYLMVDALYTQDKDEHAKALSNIAKLFETVKGNKARAQQYQDKLKTLAEKASTEPGE
jgi:hypothetical protein